MEDSTKGQMNLVNIADAASNTTNNMMKFPTLSLLPIFDGKKEDKINFFLTQFEQVACISGSNNMQKALIIKSRLKDEALKYLSSNIELQKLFDYEKVKDTMQKILNLMYRYYKDRTISRASGNYRD